MNLPYISKEKIKYIKNRIIFTFLKYKSIVHGTILQSRAVKKATEAVVKTKKEMTMSNVLEQSQVLLKSEGNEPVKVALFSAGLGDVIRVMYQTNHYKYICEATKPVHIIVASHNPFTMEIFRFHRNAHNFILYDLGHKYEECVRSGLRGPEVTNTLFNFIGASRDNMIHGNHDGSFKPQFDAPDDVDSKDHIIFQPFAGNHDARSFKPEFIEKIVSILRKQNKKVFILTRSYIRKGVSGKVVHDSEDAKQYEGGNITVLDNLSVPATLNLVKNSSAYVGSWSSMQQAAWFENKPVAVFYPVNYVDVVNRTGYAFGLDRSDCFHSDYVQFDEKAFETWVSKL